MNAATDKKYVAWLNAKLDKIISVLENNTSTSTSEVARMSIVNHGTSDTTFELTPNVFHIWGEVASLNLTLATPTDNSVVNEYTFIFVSGSTPTVLSLPNNLLWDSSIDTSSQFIEANTTYEVHIANNIVRIGGAK